MNDLVSFHFEDDFESKERSPRKMDWKEYHSLTVLNAFIESLADANKFARIINIGKSFEGRDMKVLAIEKVRVFLPLHP